MTGLVSLLGCFFLILDRETAIEGILEGMQLCMTVVIPGLFPFFFLTSLMCFSLRGQDMPVLSPLGRLMGIPRGGNYLLIPAFLGGYPMGARAISEAASNGSLDPASARRLLFFCSNGGPAFFFGVLPSVLEDKKLIFNLWILHVISAILISVLLPGKSHAEISPPQKGNLNLGEVMVSSLHGTAMVCGWILIFKMILRILNQWILWRFPVWFQTVCAGLLELTNGCSSLTEIESLPFRFILAAAFSGWGGLCVTMQTISILGDLPGSAYIIGKLLHCFFSTVLAVFLVFGHFLPVAGILTIFIFFRKALQKRGRKKLPLIV